MITRRSPGKGYQSTVKKQQATEAALDIIDPMRKYKNGGDGFVLWAEEFCYMPIFPPGSDAAVWYPLSDLPDEPHPVTGRSYKSMWENQKVEIKKALEMTPEGRFKHRLIIFVWPRGEGKSAIACLIQLWKFMCFPKQQIVLGANSKDQTKFVHFDIIRDIILNSPRLKFIIGEKNIQEKDIKLVTKDGKTGSTIRPISSFSGIVSNITGYTFSEIFDMKKPKFFTQLDGSIRNMPNALGVIDSTVSTKTHKLYQLYDAFQKNLDPTLYVSYRYSLEADYRDYWHPENTQEQLDSYKVKFTEVEYAAYFKNLWESGVSRAFPDEFVDAMRYYGVDGMVGGGPLVVSLMKQKKKLEDKVINLKMSGHIDTRTYDNEIAAITPRLWNIEDVYKLNNAGGASAPITVADLEKLGQIYNTDWVIGCGIDRADPTKKGPGADTIMSCVAKGLPNSKNNPHVDDSGSVPNYIYVLAYLAMIDSSAIEDIKFDLILARDALDGIDGIAAEKWGMFDLHGWCLTNDIPNRSTNVDSKFQIVGTDYGTQKMVFSELYTILATGRFKAPSVPVIGKKGNDILREQLKYFDHDPYKKWYGSPEKDMHGGVQDDAVYSLSQAIFSVKDLNRTHFRPRSYTGHFWGTFIPNKELVARY